MPSDQVNQQLTNAVMGGTRTVVLGVPTHNDRNMPVSLRLGPVQDLSLWGRLQANIPGSAGRARAVPVGLIFISLAMLSAAAFKFYTPTSSLSNSSKPSNEAALPIRPPVTQADAPSDVRVHAEPYGDTQTAGTAQTELPLGRANQVANEVAPAAVLESVKAAESSPAIADKPLGRALPSKVAVTAPISKAVEKQPEAKASLLLDAPTKAGSSTTPALVVTTLQGSPSTATVAVGKAPSPLKASTGSAIPLASAATTHPKVTVVAVSPDGKYVLITNPQTRLPDKYEVGGKLFTGEVIKSIDKTTGAVQLDSRTVSPE